jgi:hypothetical protein
MGDITVGGQRVDTVFDLLGKKENDITYALGWGLAQSDDLLHRFLGLVGAVEREPAEVTLDLQRYRKGEERAGITDIEIQSPNSHMIVEAKRGWNLPLEKQLRLYLAPLNQSRAAGKDARFVILTQWGETEYVKNRLGETIEGIPIVTVGLGQIAEIAQAAAVSERRQRYRQLMSELAAYLRGVAHMRNMHDNRVYVVSLSTDISEAGVSYSDVVRKLGVYWYPAGGGGGWPKTPHNYMGFRYHGQLQSVHHVDDSVVVSDLADAVGEVSRPSFGPAYVLTLGPAIPIPDGIRTGRRIQRSARRTIDIDLLLTSSTISEAWEKMVARQAGTA